MALKNFRIPLVHHDEGLKHITVESPDYQDIDRIILERRSRRHDGRRALQLGEAYLIINRESERRFREARQSSNAQPNYAFLCFDTLEEARRVSQQGLTHGNLDHCAMARASEGVSLCVYSDVLKRGVMKKKEMGWLMIVKWIPGRMCDVWLADDWPSSTQPPSEYDTLVLSFERRKQEIERCGLVKSTPERFFDLSQLFVHAKDGRPSTLLPYAIVAFKCLEQLPVEPRGTRFSRQKQPEIAEMFVERYQRPENVKNVYGRLAYSLFCHVQSVTRHNSQSPKEKLMRPRVANCLAPAATPLAAMRHVRSSFLHLGTTCKPKPQQQAVSAVRPDAPNLEATYRLRGLLAVANLDISALCGVSKKPAPSGPPQSYNELKLGGNFFVCTPADLHATPFQFSLHELDFCSCIDYRLADTILHRSWFVPGWHTRAGYLVRRSRSRHCVIDYAVFVPHSAEKEALRAFQSDLVARQCILLTVLQHDLLAFAIPDSQYSQLLELPVHAINSPYLHLVILRRKPRLFVPLCPFENLATRTAADRHFAADPELAKLVSEPSVRQFGLRSLFQHALERQRPFDKSQRSAWLSGRACSRVYDYKKNAFFLISAKFKQLVKSGRRVQSFDQLQTVFGAHSDYADLERDRQNTADLPCRTEEQLRIGAAEARAFFAEYEKALLGDSLSKTPDFGYDQERLTLQCTAPLDENDSDSDSDDDGNSLPGSKKLFSDDIFLQLAALFDSLPNSPCTIDNPTCTETQTGAEPNDLPAAGDQLEKANPVCVVNTNRLLRSFGPAHVRKPVHRYLRSLPHSQRVCTRILTELSLRRNTLHAKLAEELQLPQPFSQLVAFQNSQLTEIVCGIDDAGPVEFGALSLRNALLYVLRHPETRVKTARKTDQDDFFTNYEPFYTDLIDPDVELMTDETTPT